MGPIFAMSSGFWVVWMLRFTVASIKPQVSIAPKCVLACKTAQKLRAGSAGFALIAFWLVRFIDSRTSAFSFVIQRTCEQGMGVRSGVGREFGGVIGYDVTKDELVRVANALK